MATSRRQHDLQRAAVVVRGKQFDDACLGRLERLLTSALPRIIEQSAQIRKRRCAAAPLDGAEQSPARSELHRRRTAKRSCVAQAVGGADDLVQERRRLDVEIADEGLAAATGVHAWMVLRRN